MRTPLYLQSEAHECGLACLAMVAGHHDGRTDLAGLRSRFPLGQRGASLRELGTAAAEIGFVHRALRAEPENLRELKLPAVLHWDLDHFVVLARVRGRGCTVLDPAHGRRELSWQELGEHFTGVVVELWPGGPLRSAASERRLTLWALASGFKRSIGAIVAVSALLQVVVLAGPWQMQWAVDHALASADAHLLLVIAVAFTVLAALHAIAYWLRGALVARVGAEMSFQLGASLLRHLLRLAVDWFAKRHTGDIVSRFASLGAIRELVTTGAAALTVDVAMVALSLAAMLIYQAELALVVILVNAVFVVAYAALVPRLCRLSMAAIVADADAQAHLLESTRAIHGIKVYAQGPARLEQWQERHASALAQALSLQRTRFAVGALGTLCAGVELSLVVYLGAHLVLEQALTLGMLFAFASYRGHFNERLRSAVEAFVQLRTLGVHLTRLEDIWLAPAEPDPPERGVVPARSAGQTIELRRVGFRYAGGEAWVFKDVDLEVPAGAFVAIVGASGAGKSTLLRLMLGLVEATEGEVLLDGRRLAPSTRASVCTGAACVLQEDGFFAGSLAHNVALFRAPDLARLAEVIDAVGLREVVERLPMGYATPVGDLASGFSSGQMQRLLLARALYHRPRLLVVDEGTAHLDRASSGVFQRVVRNLRCTRIVVTHDPAFAALADRAYELTPEGLVRRDVRTSGALSAG